MHAQDMFLPKARQIFDRKSGEWIATVIPHNPEPEQKDPDEEIFIEPINKNQLTLILMKKEMSKNDFINAIHTGKKVKSYRVIAELPDGRIGIGSWYTEAVIEMVKEEIVASGAKILKIETSER